MCTKMRTSVTAKGRSTYTTFICFSLSVYMSACVCVCVCSVCNSVRGSNSFFFLLPLNGNGDLRCFISDSTARQLKREKERKVTRLICRCRPLSHTLCKDRWTIFTEDKQKKNNYQLICCFMCSERKREKKSSTTKTTETTFSQGFR